MGVIANKIKQTVLRKFEQEKDKTDISQQIDEDGFGFVIKRQDGLILVYEGAIDKFRTI